MFIYLRGEGFYGDIYDLGTVKERLKIVEFWKKGIEGLKEGEVGGRG